MVDLKTNLFFFSVRPLLKNTVWKWNRIIFNFLRINLSELSKRQRVIFFYYYFLLFTILFFLFCFSGPVEKKQKYFLTNTSPAI